MSSSTFKILSNQTQRSSWCRCTQLTCRSQNGADQGILESSQSFILSNDGLVREFVVTLSCFNELSAEIQHPGIARLQQANTTLKVGVTWLTLNNRQGNTQNHTLWLAAQFTSRWYLSAQERPCLVPGTSFLLAIHWSTQNADNRGEICGPFNIMLTVYCTESYSQSQ